MSIQQGINKTVVYKKQSALGTQATGGAGTGQKVRRETASFDLARSSFENKEISSSQQSTGVTLGLNSTTGTVAGVLSPGTYADWMSSLLRKAWAATTSLTALSITVGGTLGAYTITGTGFLVGGLKIGDVIRITAGTGNADTKDKNLLIYALTATVITCKTVNGSTMTTGAATGATIAVTGKKVIVPLTSHTKDYYTVEEWFNDITVSDQYVDMMVGSMDIGLPAEGNATISTMFAGLSRISAGSQYFTSPTAETTSQVLAAVNGLLIVNGAAVGNITGASIKIDGQSANMGAVVGSVYSPDIQRGRINVTGQFTAFFQDGTLNTAFLAGANINIIFVITDSALANAEFVSFSMSAIKLTGVAKDDGEKGLVQTVPFTAQLNGSGGAALANDQTIISIQDSLAP